MAQRCQPLPAFRGGADAAGGLSLLPLCEGLPPHVSLAAQGGRTRQCLLHEPQWTGEDRDRTIPHWSPEG